MHAPAASLAYAQTARGALPCKARNDSAANIANQNATSKSHACRPFVNKHKDGAMAASQAKIVRTPRERRLTKHEALRLVSTAIQEDYGPLASRHKVIAEDAGANSAKTAEAWTAAVSCPGVHHFLNLGMKSPAIQKMTLRLWNLDPEIDPEYQRVFSDLVRLVQGGAR
jgi:hypothetical protein